MAAGQLLEGFDQMIKIPIVRSAMVAAVVAIQLLKCDEFLVECIVHQVAGCL